MNVKQGAAAVAMMALFGCSDGGDTTDSSAIPATADEGSATVEDSVFPVPDGATEVSGYQVTAEQGGRSERATFALDNVRLATVADYYRNLLSSMGYYVLAPETEADPQVTITISDPADERVVASIELVETETGVQFDQRRWRPGDEDA